LLVVVVVVPNLSSVLISGSGIFCKNQLLFRWSVAPLNRYTKVTLVVFIQRCRVRISASTPTVATFFMGFLSPRPRPLLVSQLVYPLSVLYSAMYSLTYGQRRYESVNMVACL